MSPEARLAVLEAKFEKQVTYVIDALTDVVEALVAAQGQIDILSERIKNLETGND